jgi:hypothetical protein
MFTGVDGPLGILQHVHTIALIYICEKKCKSGCLQAEFYIYMGIWIKYLWALEQKSLLKRYSHDRIKQWYGKHMEI